MLTAVLAAQRCRLAGSVSSSDSAGTDHRRRRPQERRNPPKTAVATPSFPPRGCGADAVDVVWNRWNHWNYGIIGSISLPQPPPLGRLGRSWHRLSLDRPSQQQFPQRRRQHAWWAPHGSQEHATRDPVVIVSHAEIQLVAPFAPSPPRLSPFSDELTPHGSLVLACGGNRKTSMHTPKLPANYIDGSSSLHTSKEAHMRIWRENGGSYGGAACSSQHVR